MDYGVKEPIENIIFTIIWFAFLLLAPTILAVLFSK